MQDKARTTRTSTTAPQAGAEHAAEHSEFIDSLQKGVMIGAAVLLLVLPPLRMGMQRHAAKPAPVAQSNAPAAQAPAMQPLVVAQAPADAAPSAETPAAQQPQSPTEEQVAKATTPALPMPPLADFGEINPTPDVKLVADWSVATKDHKKNAFVVIDKKDARVYVFGPDGKLKADTPVLLGSAVGDDSAPGIGDKPLSKVKPEEKTTPAGRFVAEIGMNARKEDVVWVDYDAAVSMHRVLRTPDAIKKDRRLERLATPTPEDNRISYGCVNVPVAFFEQVLAPTVRRSGAVIYVLPETRSVQKQFGAYDPALRMQLAQAAHKQVQQ
ncbi:L,D-transpeptidase [Ramlibacter sp.]|uniref:L,D-transpeptidase n=1 Tax=Ramlibacter sp. TaxID=1917967 RepID=UPI0017EA31C9|nr:L,D-transpeptidase [Ramlibacter sp.]MBA2673019.1 L,D-transpeptidase [Ramlibacter sp.]